MSPKETLDFQFGVFYKEMVLVNFIRNIDADDLGYHDNVIIWNRSHLGEYVYSQMFRGISKKDVKARIKKLENDTVEDDVYLILLTANPKFFLSQEDGYSFSQNLEQKTKELNLFKEVFWLSSITKKRIIQVNIGKNYRKRDDIFNDVLELINQWKK